MALSVPTIVAIANQQHRRVTLLVTSDVGSTVTVHRTAGSNDPVPVRGGYEVTMVNGEILVIDYEIPQGYSLEYGVTATDGVDTLEATPVAVSPFDFGGDVVFSLGDPKGGMVINVESFPSLKYGIQQDVVRVWGRRDPVVVSGIRELPSGTLNLITLDLTERAALLDILKGGAILGFNPWKAEYGVDSIMYLSVADVTEARTSPLAAEDSRRWSLTVQQVGRPAAVWEYPLGDVQTWGEFRDSAPLWADTEGEQWLDAVGL